MWTPRRIGLLLLGFFTFFAVYAVYSRALGWLDGLPQLPVEKLPPKDGKGNQPVLPTRSDISPTEQKIIDAFGPNAAERSSVYAMKLVFMNGDMPVLIATGPLTSKPGSTKVSLVPFSMAVFGKAPPPHLRKPGETVEISTFHADKAILEYDQSIYTPQDMSKAKLVRMELVSDPEEALPDKRRGMVHITNNQRSSDPNQMLVIRTPGPMFYRDVKALKNPDSGPDVWTDAPVEVVDRNNLPHPFGQPSPETAAARGAELRDPAAVSEILLARRLPPPTLTGVGMKIFFEQEKPASAPKAEKKPGSGASGVRRIELTEKVLINLWVDSSTSLSPEPNPPGKPAAAKSANPLAVVEPPPAAAAVVGGLLDGVQTVKHFNRALLQIETLGPFAYDAATNIARFDVIAQANPDVPNDVQVSRVLPSGGQHNLFSEVLEIKFAGAPTAGPTPAPAKPAESTSGPAFEKLHAWTTTPGRFLSFTMSSEPTGQQPQAHPEGPNRRVTQPDQLIAFGEDLVYDQPLGRTILQGSPLYVLRDRNVLKAGEPLTRQKGTLVMEPGPDKTTMMTVNGPGQLEIFDAEAGAVTLQASWEKSLEQVKERIENREVDVLTFKMNSKIEDKRADYWLKGNTIKLWLEGNNNDKSPKPQGSNQPLPRHVQSVGDVTAHATDFDVEQADQLNMFFKDGVRPTAASVPPASPAVPGAPLPRSDSATPQAANPTTPTPSQPANAPSRQKPPMKMTARLIDTYILRMPPTSTDSKGGGVRYELESVHCEDRVSVHQDPTEADKPRGVDILGQTLDVKQFPQGSQLRVVGNEEKPGEVHYENISIIGPNVFIDQLHNRTKVEGRGVLQMPSNSDFNGNELAQQEDVKIFWRDGMDFAGALKNAEFRGKVVATQGESWVTCHRMLVGFDRPIYFNQMKKPGEPASGNKENAKIQSVRCEPAPGDALEDGMRSNHVYFNEVKHDPITNAVVKSQLLQAEELTLTAHGKDREQYNKVFAYGQGVVRIWQLGQKDWEAPANPDKPMPSGTLVSAPKKEQDEEEKLTVVEYGKRMTVDDKKTFQEAVFHDNITVIHVPTKDPNANFKLHQLPPGSMLLKCVNTLKVSAHRPPNAKPTQSMFAEGNAYIRTDEYEGWGETIEYDGRWIILKGNATAPARIMSRFKNTESSGGVIRLDRTNNNVQVNNGVSGQIQSPKK